MPSLSQIGDSAELINRYLRKTIVYVEGPEDAAFFNDLIGFDLAERIEFRVPGDGSGYSAVKKRVGLERPANDKIHGLLDGEAAVAFGHFEAFLTGQSPAFAIDDAALDGLLFLAEHELENLLLCHVDVVTFVTQSVPMAQVGTVQAASVDATLQRFAKRFLLLALLKFVASHFHAQGRPCKAVDERAGQFLSGAGVVHVLRDLKPKIEETGVPWTDFIVTLRKLAAEVSDFFERSGFDEAQRHFHRLRLADGKSMLNYVRSCYNGSKQWEGQLAGRLKASSYPAQFIDMLVQRTGFNDN